MAVRASTSKDVTGHLFHMVVFSEIVTLKWSGPDSSGARSDAHSDEASGKRKSRGLDVGGLECAGADVVSRGNVINVEHT